MSIIIHSPLTQIITATMSSHQLSASARLTRSSKAASTSPLLDLPPELRLQILKLLIPSSEYVLKSTSTGQMYGDTRRQSRSTTSRTVHALVISCRVLQHQTEQVLYSKTKSMILCSGTDDHPWNRKFGAMDTVTFLPKIRKMSLWVGFDRNSLARIPLREPVEGFLRTIDYGRKLSHLTIGIRLSPSVLCDDGMVQRILRLFDTLECGGSVKYAGEAPKAPSQRPANCQSLIRLLKQSVLFFPHVSTARKRKSQRS